MSLKIGGLDTETTGLLNPDHRLIEVYTGIWVNQKRVFEFDKRIDPKRGISPDAQRVHGISTGDLMGCPTWDVVAPIQYKVLEKCDMIVIHNAEFDWGFLKQEFERIGMTLPNVQVFDTMTEGIWATPDGKMPSLQELCFACEVEYDPSAAHAASYDVEVMMECFFKGVEWGFYEIPDHLVKSTERAA